MLQLRNQGYNLFYVLSQLEINFNHRSEDNIANNLTSFGGFLSVNFLFFFGCISPGSFYSSLQGLYFLLIRMRRQFNHYLVETF